MNDLRRAVFLLLVSGVVLLAGCTQGNSGDDAASATANIPLGLDRFLLFPNPIVDGSGNFQTNTNAYAQAYYAAIDPLNAKDTLDKWKAANGFGGVGVGAGGAEFMAVFRDVRDLGYGRRMTGRRNTDGSIAFVVENYHVSNVPGGYSTVNVEAARLRDTQWHVGTNAIEWSTATCTPGEDPANCNGAIRFAKFFNFDPVTGQRQNILDLDQRGQKAMPGICTNCHGGRADPLTPESDFALVENSLSRKRGDVQAKLQAFNVDSFEWSTTSPFTRAEQEAVLKAFNQWVLCSYPGAASVTGTWGTCNRQPAGANEWTGTAASDIIEQAYGGAGMINARFNDVYMPTNWNSHATLYRDAVVPYCRTCHILRGTASQSDIDFDDEPKFESYAQRIKTHVFDRGNMPLAFLVYQDFWESNAPSILADYIDSLAITGLTATSGGSPLRPGRPIADPGPDRMVGMGTDAILYGGDSLFADSYLWEVVAGGSASIASPTSARTTFSASVGGNYTVRLTVTGGGQTDSKTMTVTVSNTFPDPTALKFAHVKNILQNVSNCDTCHLPTNPQVPPIWYTDFDRNYDLLTGAADIFGLDEARFYREILGRVNFTEAGNSPLLRKPSDPEVPDDINHHNGGNVLDLADFTTSGGLWNFSVIYNWILNGAPSGGVVASAGADSTGNVTFAGSPATSTVALNGSPSIGATTYAWTIQSFVPAVHPNGTTVPQTGATAATISSANSANATLNVFDIGAYVVRLAVSNGTDSDFDERSITVTESPITGLTASPTGTQALTFSGPGQTATLNLSVSTGGGSGTPQTYTWAYAPLSATNCGTINSPNSATPTVTVPVAAANSNASCTFRVTASNLSTTDFDDTAVTITAAVGQNPSGASFSYPASSIRFTVEDSAANPPSARINDVATSSIPLDGAVTSGVATLAYTWSLPSGAGTAGCSTPAAGDPTSLPVTRAGTCTVRLTVSNGILPNATFDAVVTISSAVSFTTVGTRLNGTCGACHSNAAMPISTPSFVNDLGLHGRLTVVPDPDLLVNTVTPQSSRILTCPNLGNCGMVAQPGFSGADLSDYDEVLTWIINGAVSSP